MYHSGKKTKVIATYGPSCSDISTLKQMIHKGVDMFRINASHIDNSDAIIEMVKKIKEVSEIEKKYVGVFLDLQGPKIRLGTFENDKVSIVKNESFTLTSTPMQGTNTHAYISYKNFASDVKLDDIIFIDDGKIILTVNEINGNDVTCKVVRGGLLQNHKGVNLPMTEMSVNPFTDKDKGDTLNGIIANVDYIALSFVSSPQNVTDFRNFLNQNNGDKIQIIAKIERQKALDNLDSIIDTSDAIMVARGDLGVEVGIEKVPQIQKNIVNLCNKKIKPVIVATQMLESMISSELATRAEVSDVANAIYDNCDAVMLSGETAVGINPVQVIETMVSICTEADNHLDQLITDNQHIIKPKLSHSVATSFCIAASQVSLENNASAIMAFTSSGNTPLIASKTKTPHRIIAPTDAPYLCSRMSIYKGVTPILLPKKFKDITRWRDMISLAVTECKAMNYLKQGDVAVITAGIPIGKSNGINSIRIITVD